MGIILETTPGGRKMLKLVESFDHIGTGTGGTPDMTLFHGLGWVFGQPPYWAHFAAVVAGLGRMGSRALQFPTNVSGGEMIFALPTIQRKCKKIIMGFSMMRGGDVFILFKYDQHTNFTIKITIDSTYWWAPLQPGRISVSMQTGGTDPFIGDTRWAGYPEIVTAEKIPAPFTEDDYHFIELYLDVTDYHNGVAKVAVDGRTYFNKTGIITAAYNTFGDNPYDDRANLNRVKCILMPVIGEGNNVRVYPIFDCFYLADDQGGYQDDFLGDIFTKTAYPIADGTKRNWIPVVNSTIVDPSTGHFTLLDSNPIHPGDETEYVEADQDLTEDMLGFAVDPIPEGSDLIAVNHRTMYRNVASPGSPLINSLTPLFQMIGNPIVRTDSLTKKLTGWAYGFLDVYYPIVPVSAALWEEYILEQAEFGYMLKTAENLQVVQEEILFADLVNLVNIRDEILEEELPIADDTTENSLDIAVWDITIEEELPLIDAPDDGVFLADDAGDIVDAVTGLYRHFTFELIYPVLTGGSQGATASSELGGGYNAWNGFDGVLSTGGMWSAGAAGVQWLKIDLEREGVYVGEKRRIVSYALQARTDGYTHTNIRTWIVYGSNDDADWTELDSQADITWENGERKVFPLSEPSAEYRYFKIEGTPDAGMVCIGEWQLYDYAPEADVEF